MTVFGNARRLLKNLAAIRALNRQDLINASLTDIGIALPSETRIHKQFVNVTQADGLPVDIVFAFTGTIIPAGDHQLVRVVSDGAVGIIQNKRRLREADLRTLFRTAENDILHFLTAQRAGALLSHDPTDRVGDIRFSAAVRSDDRGNIMPKADDRPIRKRLEALNFQLFQIHWQNAPIVFCNKVLYQISRRNASRKHIFCILRKKF